MVPNRVAPGRIANERQQAAPAPPVPQELFPWDTVPAAALTGVGNRLRLELIDPGLVIQLKCRRANLARCEPGELEGADRSHPTNGIVVRDALEPTLMLVLNGFFGPACRYNLVTFIRPDLYILSPF